METTSTLASRSVSLTSEDGRVVCEHLLVAARPLRRMRGLLGRSELPSDQGILLRPAGSVHTFFMRFPIDVVFLDRDTLSPETVLRPLEFPHELKVYDRTSADEVAGRIADAEIVITNKAPVRGDSLEDAQTLKPITVGATGTYVICLKAT